MGGNSQYVFVREATPPLHTTNSTDNDLSTVTFQHTVPAGDFRLMVVFVKARIAGNQPVNSVKFGAASATFVTRAVTGGVIVVELWRLVAPTVGTDTIEVIWNATTTSSVVEVLNFVGVSQSLPFNGTGVETFSSQRSVIFDSLPLGITVPGIVVAGLATTITGAYPSPELKSNMVTLTESAASGIIAGTYVFLPETDLDKNMQVAFPATPDGWGIIGAIFRELSIVTPGTGWAW